MAKFKKGDICIVLWSRSRPELKGEEVTLTSDLIKLKYGNPTIGPSRQGYGYRTNIPKFCPMESQLKLKDPPEESNPDLDWAKRAVEKLKQSSQSLDLVQKELAELEAESQQ